MRSSLDFMVVVRWLGWRRLVFCIAACCTAAYCIAASWIVASWAASVPDESVMRLIVAPARASHLSYHMMTGACGVSRAMSRETISLLGKKPLAAPRSLSGELVARLTDDITSGRIPPGSRLPTEQQLIAATGVSRTVVREAVAALRADGLVVTRQGIGAFVPENARRPLRIEFDRLSPLRAVLDIMELRTGIEIEAAGL